MLNVGILGTSNIARKNIQALASATTAAAYVVGSRNADRAAKYAAECNVPKSYGSYTLVVEDPNVAAVYIPLPTTHHLEWVVKAAEMKKHILCEKPLAINIEELIEMLRAVKANDVVFMDGVMFMHHQRLTQLRNVFDQSFGKAGPRQINSQFSFKGDASFFANNIRVSKQGDPLGSLGDLGWYNVRFSLFTFGYQLPKSVRCVVQSSSEDGVPYQVVGTMTWSEEEEEEKEEEEVVNNTERQDVPIAPRSSTFVCSFLATECQNVTICGEECFVEMDDFVIPKDPMVTSFTTVKHNWGPKAQRIQVAREETNCEGDQTVAMWECFASMALGAANGKETETEKKDHSIKSKRDFFVEVAIKTQLVIDALMESSKNGGAEVLVPELPVV